MKLHLDRLLVCLLCLTGTARYDGNGPAVIIVEEGTDVLLPCSLSTKENIESKHFYWAKFVQKDEPWKDVFIYNGALHDNNGGSGQSKEFKGRVSHFQDELKNGNASIVIRNTRVTDSGNYICAFPRLQPPLNVELVVAASPKPNIKKPQTKDGSLFLECEVQGAFPKPEVEWRDSAGNKLPAAEPQVTECVGKYYIVLNTTVTKTDEYTCVSTQKKINHQISDKISVEVNELSTGSIVAIVICTLFVVGFAGLVLRHFLKDWLSKKCLCCKKDVENDGAQTTPNGGQNMILSPLTTQNQIPSRSKEVSFNADRADCQ